MVTADGNSKLRAEIDRKINSQYFNIPMEIGAIRMIENLIYYSFFTSQYNICIVIIV